MIRALTLLGLFAFTITLVGGNKQWNAGLHYKFDPVFGFIQLPRTVEAIKKDSYKQVENPTVSSGYDKLALWIKEDQSCKLIGLLTDECDLVAGMQINLPKDEVSTYYDETKQGFTSWTYNGEEYWYLRVYFVSEDEQTRRAACDKTKTIRDEFISVSGVGGELTKIQTDPMKIDPIWTKQACVPLMGQHYYYDMTPTLTCDKPFQTSFPLYDMKANQMLGVGLMFIGNTTCDTEKPSKAAVQMIVPTAPECLYDYVEKYGVTTLHIYFNDHPRLITC